MQGFRLNIKHFLASLLVGVFLLFGFVQAKAFQLSDKAEISLITCAPGNGASTVYGHTAIRVKDFRSGYDIAFNYGIYDFDAPNFLYRFASGETDYLLAGYKFDAFVNSYKRNKRSVHEQVLDLTPVEKQNIVDFLIWNAKPENRIYRYNFFFDNCATRVRDVIADNVEGGITFNEEKYSHKTLRQLVEDYHGKLLWLTFGIDLVVSSESDREVTFWEEMLLPDYLMNHFAEATKTSGNIPLVKKTITVYESGANEYKQSKLLDPFFFFLFVAVLLAIFSFKQFKKNEMRIGFDYFIYGFIGLMGVVMSWMAIYSEHPAMSPNYNLLWALPINLLFVFVLIVKKWRAKTKYYHLFISVWLILFVAFSVFIPQEFHPVFYLLIIIVLCRSIFHSLLILKERKSKS